MDKIIVNSRLFKLFISKVVRRILKKSMGIDAKFTMGDLDLTHANGCTKVNVAFSIEAKDGELIKLLKLFNEKEET